MCGEPGGLSLHYWPAFGDPKPDVSDIRVFRRKPWQLILWEPLPTKAPGPHLVRPWCCYICTVVFYARPFRESPHRRYLSWHDYLGRYYDNGIPILEELPRPVIKVCEVGSFVEYDRIDHRLRWDTQVVFEGEIYEVGGGCVRWCRPQWYMMRWARRIQKREAAA